MNTYNRYYCTSCYNVWDQNQCLPKLLACGHSFCFKCLQRLLKNNQIICPDDMKSFRVDSLNQLPTNQELLHPQLQITPHSQQDISSENITQSTTRLYTNLPDNSVTIKKPLSPHQQDQIPWNREQLQQSHQLLQESHQQFELNQQTNFNEAFRMILQQKRSLIELIQQNFSELQIKLSNIESQLLNELNIVALKLEDDIRQMHIVTDKKAIAEIKQIQERIEQLLLLSDENLNTKADLVNNLTHKTELVINHLNKQPSFNIQHIITKEMQLKFDLSVYDYLPTFCTLKKYKCDNRNQSQQRRAKTLTDSNDYTYAHSNQSLSDNSPKPKGHDNSSAKPFQYSKNAHHLEEPPYQRLNPRELTFGGKSQHSKSRDSKNSRSLSSSKLYEATGIARIQDLLFKGLPIEKLDLTNQNLNDLDLLDLLKLIQRSASQIEILKLTKNRITDNGFSHLLTLLLKRSDIHTLNLSNNECTEKSIDLIERRIQQLHGKTIYLSNCKLSNLNQLKKRQISLQSRGVTLFL
ncbi:unnamed protein product [Paramecium octaurelia]|uniref:RING-type domain-containing protein n=1 Tax=Paramecium octaurelia TaxID=43137 RepID=A0A8S1WWR6_PAROT|nr:unnamed protein product [Paramecium octaurelia]